MSYPVFGLNDADGVKVAVRTAPVSHATVVPVASRQAQVPATAGGGSAALNRWYPDGRTVTVLLLMPLTPRSKVSATGPAGGTRSGCTVGGRK